MFLNVFECLEFFLSFSNFFELKKKSGKIRDFFDLKNNFLDLLLTIQPTAEGRRGCSLSCPSTWQNYEWWLIFKLLFQRPTCPEDLAADSRQTLLILTRLEIEFDSSSSARRSFQFGGIFFFFFTLPISVSCSLFSRRDIWDKITIRHPLNSDQAASKKKLNWPWSFRDPQEFPISIILVSNHHRRRWNSHLE